MNLFAEGFATYGLGSTFPTSSAVYQNLLAGTYAECPSENNAGIGQLPWDPANTDIYFFNKDQPTPLRLVVSADPCILSVYYAVDQLPGVNGEGYAIAFRDASNVIIARLVCQSTGVMTLYDGGTNILVSTSGPVIVAETATHLEMKLTASGSFLLKVNDVAVITASGLTFTGSGGTEQIGFVEGPNAFGAVATQYISNLIVRDTNGSVNNDFVGDRRVATLFVNADDLAHQGWTAQPRHRFGTGILDNRAAGNSCVTAANSTSTDLGSGDYTIEGSFRFFSLPTESNKAVLFGKWDETNNKRSYQLYMGGPALNSGVTAFRHSTNGAAGTVTTVFSYPWVPETDRWYHVAVVRTSGEVLFFVDGVQLGLPAADAATYYAGSETTALGAQDDSGVPVANTAFTGFTDEFRLSVGVARYTSGFTPPIAAFPRGSLSDPDWSSVAWLSGWDSGLFDESAFARTLTAQNGSAVLTPDDGTFNYQVLAKPTPFDDTFIEAALTQATGILTQTVQPANNATVTLGTTDGTTPAVYTWKTALTGAAFEVKIGASLPVSLANIVAAINASAGAGTLYGTGTTANFNVSASLLPVEQILVTALVAGTAGNAIASTTNDTNGSWGHATLTGGVDIPAYSAFYFQRPPNETTIIDSISLVHRDFKTDSGTANVQASFVGGGGGVAAGANNPVTTVPTYYRDTIEIDPDTSAALTPSTLVSGKIKLNRTA